MENVAVMLLADTEEKLARIHDQATKLYKGLGAVAYDSLEFYRYPDIINWELEQWDGYYEFVWVLTPWADAKKGDLELLMEIMANGSAAIAHPTMMMSTYPHMRSGGGLPIKRVPYIEFVAPLIRVSAWAQCRPEPSLGSLWVLEWCYRLRLKGLYTYVHRYVEMSVVGFPVLEKDEASVEYLKHKYGAVWESRIWPRQG